VQAVQAVQPARTPQPTQALEVTSKDSVISVDPPPATAGDGQTLRSRELRSSTPSVMGGPEASPMARAAPLEVARSTEASAPTPAVVQHPGEAAGRAAGGAAAATEGLQNIAVAAAALNSASVMAPAALALGGDHVGSDDVGTDGNLVTAAAQPGTATGIDTAGVVAPSSAPLAAAGADRAGATVATHRLDAHPASLAFAAEVSTRITTFVSAGVHHARLELNPAEMGPVTVQIQLSGQAAQVHLAAESADTRRALEQSMPQLASTLRQAGLTLSGGGVFEQPRPPQQQERETGTSQARARSAAIERASAASVAPLTSAARRRGVVDLVA
jgi:flagellar hook-length control protein FliK